MRFSRAGSLLLALGCLLRGTNAIKLSQTPGRAELIDAAAQAKKNMLTFYVGDKPGQTPGVMLRPDLFYWWQAGGMFGQLIHHWHLTGDTSSNAMITKAMQWQVGDDKNYEPVNQTNDIGNDDQMFWAFAAMDAAELGFPEAPEPAPSWLSLAQAVFNRQAPRWDTEFCGGGMRWQIYEWKNGWTYKNTPTNGGLFHLSARLARYTGNQTYADEAIKIWNWMEALQIINETEPGALQVYDGVDFANNCTGTAMHKTQFTYNLGTVLSGAAFLYNVTGGGSLWRTRITKLLAGMNNVYLVHPAGANDPMVAPELGGQIISESADEFQEPTRLDLDDPSFKAYTIRWMALCAQLAPFSAATIMPIIHASVQGAAGQCIGHSPPAETGWCTAVPSSGDNWCGRRWYQTTWDKHFGLGEQMSAMSVFSNALIGEAPPPLSANTGGVSKSNPGAGGAPLPGPNVLSRDITAADRFGAIFLTLLFFGLTLFGLWFMAVG